MLNIQINSFSYKSGIPEDTSGNGGGFVFDCRGILNPGRIDEYKTQTGRDLGVQEYLEAKTKIQDFLDSAFEMVSINIQNYLSRNFTNLSISFGCTGGQHRSVYSADKMAEFIQKQFSKVKIQINVSHIEQEKKNWVNKMY